MGADSQMIDQNSRQVSKVFIGGLSWETTGEKLRAYFENYGVVREAFVSYNRNNGRPRGFGFVVFESPEVADKVVACKHTIDRREVEAKKAVPKDEQLLHAEQQQNYQMPPSGPASSSDRSNKSRKIFIGGLAPSVDEAMLRQHFEMFGSVEDAVVMYDHDNKRPRGFGFVTFASEESVDLVFAKGAMQTIQDKPIEIKSAVPRDQMPFSSKGPAMNGYQDTRYAGPRPGNSYPPYSNYGAGIPSQFNGLPRGYSSGAHQRNYAPTVQPNQRSLSSNPYNDGGLPGISTGFSQAAVRPQVNANGLQGSVPGLPPGFDIYGGGASMFGPNSQAALAYNLATLQHQAQAHLNGMNSAGGAVGASAAGKLSASALGANALNLKALALAGGFGGAFPSQSDATGGFSDHQTVTEASLAAAEAAVAAAGFSAGGEFGTFRDPGAYPTNSSGWSS
ncbi:hypothetical protein CEUSTIGMA_g6720.t1 [Chlamydomonas eustigma]|uniref:RRM domain-containing protein n=1 Tax=Chlamydomonas eustigma TaxID=1157962 RepID=A0A250X933_9CHLO|nr:hypothetical protein CEUSTIGMA_g6720.t1 [Chlamydomonas eustigma]|eukprot:GAX79280.1 hypothetical protein CEUSTIGMA_g6720.t1 [Chlamydomonas eustigma]